MVLPAHAAIRRRLAHHCEHAEGIFVHLPQPARRDREPPDRHLSLDARETSSGRTAMRRFSKWMGHSEGKGIGLRASAINTCCPMPKLARGPLSTKTAVGRSSREPPFTHSERRLRTQHNHLRASPSGRPRHGDRHRPRRGARGDGQGAGRGAGITNVSFANVHVEVMGWKPLSEVPHPSASAMIPTTMAAAATRRRVEFPSESNRAPMAAPTRMEISRAGAT